MPSSADDGLCFACEQVRDQAGFVKAAQEDAEALTRDLEEANSLRREIREQADENFNRLLVRKHYSTT